MKQKKSKKSKFKVRESPKRSLAKAITFRIFATLATMATVFVLTGEMFLTLGIGIVDVISKLILYYFHERMWDLIDWSRVFYRINSGKK